MFSGELIKIELGGPQTTDVTLSIKKQEILTLIKELPPTDPKLKGIPESLICQEPIRYKGLFYFARFCSINLADNMGNTASETVKEPAINKEMIRAIKEYRKALQDPKIEEVYNLACNASFSHEGAYVTKEETKLQFRFLSRENLVKKFAKQKVMKISKKSHFNFSE